MTTKAILNIDKALKIAAMKKAKAKGLTFSAFVNLATRAFVDGRLDIGLLGRAIDDGRNDVRMRRTIAQEKLFRKLGF